MKYILREIESEEEFEEVFGRRSDGYFLRQTSTNQSRGMKRFRQTQTILASK